MPSRRISPSATALYGRGLSISQRAALHQFEPAILAELVALGMAAEIIVVVQDQHARLRPRRAIEMRRRQAADAAADHDQLVARRLVRRLVGGGPERAVPQAVRGFERAGMAAAQAVQKGRVRGWRFGHRGVVRGARAQQRHATQEIPPRDGPVHP